MGYSKTNGNENINDVGLVTLVSCAFVFVCFVCNIYTYELNFLFLFGTIEDFLICTDWT